MTLKRYYLTLPMGYVVANSKAEAKEILEQDYDRIHMGGDFISYTVTPHEDYEISKVSEKITKKDIPDISNCYSKDLNNLIKKLMKKNPNDRPNCT